MPDDFFSKLKHFFLPCQENIFRPKFLESRFLYYYAIFLIVLKFAVIPFFFYFPQSGFFADITKTSLIDLVNLDRQNSGVATLTESTVLNQAAYLKAQDMLANDYFAHISPQGTSPWFWFDETGYSYRYAGENLAIGFLESNEVNQAWLDSPSHRKNIMNENYTEIGIAVVSGEFQGNYTTVVVQLFGKPQSQIAKVISKSSSQSPVSEKVLSENSAPSEATSETKTIQQSGGQAPKLVLSAYDKTESQNDFIWKLTSFFNSDYYDWLQKIILWSLILIILMLANAVLFDIFVYRAYEIQYKDIFVKTIGFCLILLVLMHFDKGAIIQLIPHNFKIY